MEPVILTEIDLSAELRERLPGTVRTVGTDATPDSELKPLPEEMLRDVTVLLCKKPPANMDDMGSLKLLQLGTVGYEHLWKFRLWERPIRVCNARGVFDSAIAEWNVGMMLNFARDVPAMFRNQQTKTWDRSPRFQQELRGKTVGLWGYGGIGRETARLSKALGLTVWVMTRSGVGPRVNTFTPEGTGDPEGKLPDRVFTADGKDEFLAGLDYFILCLPRTRDSDGMIGEAELRRLPNHAVLLNPSRGPIVRQQALIDALKNGWIAGAALDTHYAYPPADDHPFWTMPNVILTPHVSGADRSDAFPGRFGELFVENVERFVAGRPLLNELTRREWEESLRHN